MSQKKSFHSICRWTFNSGKGGFVPNNIRPAWDEKLMSTSEVVRLIKEKIAPRLPEHIVLGYEVHYDNEVNEKNAEELTAALNDAGIYLALLTPGAHVHFAYGGIASLDEVERKKACEFGERTIDLGYGHLRKAWYPQAAQYPTMVLWNGSYGYDLASPGIQNMYENLKQGIADFCRYEQKKGNQYYIAIEPKPNEGHAAMLLPTVASALLFWKKLESQYGIPLQKKGLNKEFGHSEMIGLDHVYDTVEEIDQQMLVHMHVNSQGYNDGIILGGPGKFDIDNGARINGMNIAIAAIIREAGYNRWKGHDMQPRPYDNEEQGIKRVIRSILSWEACEKAVESLNIQQLLLHLSLRDTAKAEDMMREAVMTANTYFKKLYQ
jgi:xylose isomerase